MLAQFASSAANRVTPGGTGIVATIARYLERSGLSRTEAGSAVTLTITASVVVHVTAFGIVAALLAQVGIRDVHLPSRSVVLFVVIGVAVAAGLLFWSPSGRHKVLPVIREGARSLRAVLRRPTMDAGQAIASVLTFRIITYWLPMLPGVMALRLLQRDGAL